MENMHMKQFLMMLALCNAVAQSMEPDLYYIDNSLEEHDIDLGYMSDSSPDIDNSVTITTTNMLFDAFDDEINPNDNHSLDAGLTISQSNPLDHYLFSKEYFKVTDLEFGTRISPDANIKHLEALIDYKKEHSPITCCNRTFYWKSFIDHYAQEHRFDGAICPNPACQRVFANSTNACAHYLCCIQHDMFQCPSCAHVYSTKDSLLSHFLKCINDSPHLLRRKANNKKRSDDVTISKLEKKNHRLNTYLNNKTMVLSGCCNKHFATWKALKSHLLSEHTKNKFVSCPWPECPTRNLSKFIGEVASCYVVHFDPNFFTCTNCKKTCTTYQKLKDHYVNCKKTFEPDPQLYQLLKTNEYQTGLKTLLEEREHKKICRSTQQPNPHVQSIYTLILHRLQEKFEANTITCCNTPIKSITSLSAHIKKYHKAKKKGFNCPHCGKGANSTSRVVSCFLNSTDATFFECIFCNHILNSQESLVSHIALSCLNVIHYIAKTQTTAEITDIAQQGLQGLSTNTTLSQDVGTSHTSAQEMYTTTPPSARALAEPLLSASAKNNIKRFPRVILKISTPKNNSANTSFANASTTVTNQGPSLEYENYNNTNCNRDYEVNEC